MDFCIANVCVSPCFLCFFPSLQFSDFLFICLLCSIQVCCYFIFFYYYHFLLLLLLLLWNSLVLTYEKPCLDNHWPNMLTWVRPVIKCYLCNSRSHVPIYVSIHIKHFIFPKLFHFFTSVLYRNSKWKILSKDFSSWLLHEYTFYLIGNTRYKGSNTIHWTNIWDFIFGFGSFSFCLFLRYLFFFFCCTGWLKTTGSQITTIFLPQFPKPWNYRQEPPSPVVLLCSFFSKFIEKTHPHALFEWKLYIWSSTDHARAKINIPTL